MDCQELLMFRSGDVLTIANAGWFIYFILEMFKHRRCAL